MILFVLYETALNLLFCLISQLCYNYSFFVFPRLKFQKFLNAMNQVEFALI